MTEGVIDHLRSIEGTKVAAVVRDLGNGGAPRARSASAPATATVDVSAIARKHGGEDTSGPPASPPTSSSTTRRLHLRRDRRPARRLSMAAPATTAALLLCDKPAGVTSHDVVARVRRERGRQSRPRRHPRPLRDRPAVGPARHGDARAALPRRPAEDLPGDRRLGLALQHRRPRRRADRDRRVPGLARPADRHRSPAGADDLGGQGRRRAPLQEGPPRRARSRCPVRDVEVHRAELLAAATASAALRDRVLGRDLRPHPGRDPRRCLLLGPAPHRDRPLRESRTRATSSPSSGSAELVPAVAEALR